MIDYEEFYKGDEVGDVPHGVVLMSVILATPLIEFKDVEDRKVLENLTEKDVEGIADAKELFKQLGKIIDDWQKAHPNFVLLHKGEATGIKGFLPLGFAQMSFGEVYSQ